MTFLSTMETCQVLLVFVGIIGVILFETTPTFVHFQVLIGLTRTTTLNIAHIVHIHFRIGVSDISNPTFLFNSKMLSELF